MEAYKHARDDAQQRCSRCGLIFTDAVKDALSMREMVQSDVRPSDLLCMERLLERDDLLCLERCYERGRGSSQH